jgi:hypothetical protein
MAGLAAAGGALFGATSGWFQHGLGDVVDAMRTWVPDRAAVSDAVVAMVGSHLTVAIAIGALVVLAPALAVWVTRERV